MKDFMSLIKNMDKAQLNEAIQKAKEFSKTDEGKKAIEKLRRGEAIEGIPVSGEDQNKMISQLSQNPEVAKRIAEILGGKR